MPLKHSDPNVELGVNKLVEIGVLTEEGLAALGKMVRSLQSFGSPPGSDGRTQRRTRRARTRFTVTEGELKKLYATGTAKAIAEQYGVSTATVSNRWREFGIQKEGRATPKKAQGKKTRKKAKKTRKAKKKSSKKKASSKRS